MTVSVSTLKSVLAAIALSVPLVIATGCGDGKADKKAGDSAASGERVFRAEDFADKPIGVLSGSTFEAVAREAIGAKIIKFYDSTEDAVAGVLSGEVEAMLAEEPIGKAFVAANPDVLMVLNPPVDIENYAAIFPKEDNGKLRGEFDAFLEKIRSGEVYDDMVKRWVDTPETPPMPELAAAAAKGKPVLTFATSDCDKPFSFMASSGKLEGFDVEMALRFAREYGYGLEIKTMDFADIIPAVQAASVSFASNLITVTDERKAFIDFSEPVYYSGTVVVTKK